MASVTALVAHQGGWDEVLLVAGPVVVIIVALTLAKRRVDRLERADTSGSGAGDEPEERGVAGDHTARGPAREAERSTDRTTPESGDRR